MIRVYCSIPRFARNLHSLKKLKRDTANLKNYSVSVNKEAESVAAKSIKDLIETETEVVNSTEENDVTAKSDKTVLLSALSNLKKVEDETEVVEKIPVELGDIDVTKLVAKDAAKQKLQSAKKKDPNYEELSKQIKAFLKKNPPKRPYGK